MSERSVAGSLLHTRALCRSACRAAPLFASAVPRPRPLGWTADRLQPQPADLSWPQRRRHADKRSLQCRRQRRSTSLGPKVEESFTPLPSVAMASARLTSRCSTPRAMAADRPRHRSRRWLALATRQAQAVQACPRTNPLRPGRDGCAPPMRQMPTTLGCDRRAMARASTSRRSRASALPCRPSRNLDGHRAIEQRVVSQKDPPHGSRPSGSMSRYSSSSGQPIASPLRARHEQRRDPLGGPAAALLGLADHGLSPVGPPGRGWGRPDVAARPSPRPKRQPEPRGTSGARAAELQPLLRGSAWGLCCWSASALGGRPGLWSGLGRCGAARRPRGPVAKHRGCRRRKVGAQATRLTGKSAGTGGTCRRIADAHRPSAGGWGDLGLGWQGMKRLPVAVAGLVALPRFAHWPGIQLPAGEGRGTAFAAGELIHLFPSPADRRHRRRITPRHPRRKEPQPQPPAPPPASGDRKSLVARLLSSPEFEALPAPTAPGFAMGPHRNAQKIL